MVLGGLNEGVWPALPAPDPWLAPRIRAELGLPSLERRIGLAAHDFACGLGAPRVLVTRSRRDARAPAVASRLWLRIEAMTGGVTRALPLAKWARAIDRPEAFVQIARPAPSPPVDERPRKLSVTEVDRLKADPFAFYARRVLGLNQLDAVDADPSAAWRGSSLILARTSVRRPANALAAALPRCSIAPAGGCGSKQSTPSRSGCSRLSRWRPG